MNLVEAKIDIVDGDVHVQFGGQRLHVDDAVLERRPALKGMDGAPVILGIRPEDMEDASLDAEAPQDRRIRSEVELTEAMGSEIYVHFELDAPVVLTEDTRELMEDRGAEDEFEDTGARTTFIGRFHPTSRARIGDEVEISVDTTRLHFFDPETGASILG
jgi:multiple sugar transport system ATP-binding protein